jgi:hypothetical protein
MAQALDAVTYSDFQGRIQITSPIQPNVTVDGLTASYYNGSYFNNGRKTFKGKTIVAKDYSTSVLDFGPNYRHFKFSGMKLNSSFKTSTGNSPISLILTPREDILGDLEIDTLNVDCRLALEKELDVFRSKLFCSNRFLDIPMKGLTTIKNLKFNLTENQFQDGSVLSSVALKGLSFTFGDNGFGKTGPRSKITISGSNPKIAKYIPHGAYRVAGSVESSRGELLWASFDFKLNRNLAPSEFGYVPNIDHSEAPKWAKYNEILMARNSKCPSSKSVAFVKTGYPNYELILICEP